MVSFIPTPKIELQASYLSHCAEKNLNSVRYFSILAIVVFGLHLIHHLRLGAEIFSTNMLPYTLLYSVNILYAIVNVLVFPKMRNVQALHSIAVFLLMSYTYFLAFTLTFLSVVEVFHESAPIAFVVGMLVVSIILQGHLLALFGLLISCYLLLTFGLLYSLPVEQVTPHLMTCFSVILISAFVARLIEKSRIEMFLMSQELELKQGGES